MNEGLNPNSVRVTDATHVPTKAGYLTRLQREVDRGFSEWCKRRGFDEKDYSFHTQMKIGFAVGKAKRSRAGA